MDAVHGTCRPLTKRSNQGSPCLDLFYFWQRWRALGCPQNALQFNDSPDYRQNVKVGRRFGKNEEKKQAKSVNDGQPQQH